MRVWEMGNVLCGLLVFIVLVGPFRVEVEKLDRIKFLLKVLSGLKTTLLANLIHFILFSYKSFIAEFI